MDKQKKSSMLYHGVFLAISVFQLFIIHGVLSSNTAKETISQLYVDGADFSQLISLIGSGINSLSFSISVFSAVLWGTIIALIVMSVVRRISKDRITKEKRSENLKITIVLSIIFFLIGCFFSGFKIIDTVLIMYLPVPVISWMIFHIGKS
ncbi:MAG: hypothetical protein PUE12_17460 [Oscillospiraceae bacterium]|nr:hypothetical protein [Oscillospiraceae bacterium]